MGFKAEEHFRQLKGQNDDKRRQPKTPEHRAKISAALARYAQRADSHLRALHVSGPEAPAFKTGSSSPTYRRLAFEAYGTACQCCGSTRHVNVHHRDGDHANSSLDNLQVLCRGCHNREHGLGGDVRAVTHCPQGHEYTPENTYVWTNKTGCTRRSCRECARARNRQWYARQMAKG